MKDHGSLHRFQILKFVFISFQFVLVIHSFIVVIQHFYCSQLRLKKGEVSSILSLLLLRQ